MLKKKVVVKYKVVVLANENASVQLIKRDAIVRASRVKECFAEERKEMKAKNRGFVLFLRRRRQDDVH